MKSIILIFLVFFFSFSQDIPPCIKLQQVHECLNIRNMTKQIQSCFLNTYKSNLSIEDQWITYTQFYLMAHIYCAQQIVEQKSVIQQDLIVKLNKAYEEMINQTNNDQDKLQLIEIQIYEIQKSIEKDSHQLEKDKEIIQNLLNEQDNLNSKISEQFSQFHSQFQNFNKESLQIIQKNSAILKGLQEFFLDMLLQQTNYKILLHCFVFSFHNATVIRMSAIVKIFYIISFNISLFIERSEIVCFSVILIYQLYLQFNLKSNKYQSRLSQNPLNKTNDEKIIIQQIMKILVLCLLITAIVGRNEAPVIGILTIPSDDDYTQYPSSQYSYFAASYVKYVESAGARVLPIPYEADEDTLTKYFNQINGLLLTGGTLALETSKGPSKYLQTVTFLLNKVTEANDRGDIFPLIAICLGHQTLHFILSNKDYNVLSPAQGLSRVSRKLTLTDKTSLMFQRMKKSVQDAVENEELVYFNTSWGVLPQYYQDHDQLNQFFKIVALNTDKQGKIMIAAVEGRKYPIFSIGFHPEKPIFEFKVPGQHLPDSIQFGRNIINQFVEICRENNHKFTATDKIIFKYNPVQLSSASFAQIYFFKLGELTI